MSSPTAQIGLLLSLVLTVGCGEHDRLKMKAQITKAPETRDVKTRYRLASIHSAGGDGRSHVQQPCTGSEKPMQPRDEKERRTMQLESDRWSPSRAEG
jgi:hypothetical protein